MPESACLHDMLNAPSGVSRRMHVLRPVIRHPVSHAARLVILYCRQQQVSLRPVPEEGFLLHAPFPPLSPFPLLLVHPVQCDCYVAMLFLCCNRDCMLIAAGNQTCIQAYRQRGFSRCTGMATTTLFRSLCALPWPNFAIPLGDEPTLSLLNLQTCSQRTSWTYLIEAVCTCPAPEHD